MTDINAEPKSLAAIVFGDGDHINLIMAEFAEDLRRSGRRVAGFVQVLEPGPDGRPEAYVRDLETGVHLPIFQNLGRNAQACRIDPGALVEIGRLITEALARGPDLLVINRFGRLESEGEGIIDEIAAAAASGVPVLVGVAARYHEAWQRFAMDIGAELDCSRQALDHWWRMQPAAADCDPL